MSGKCSPGTRHAVLVLAVLIAADLCLGVAAPRSSFATHVEAPLSFGECRDQLGFDESRNAADTDRLVKRMTGSLEQLVDTVVDVQSTMKLPYRAPSRSERDQFQCGFDLARAGALGTAASVLDAIGYQVLLSADRRLVALQERVLWPDPRAVESEAYRGWGLYVIARDGGANVTVEAPHACENDEQTGTNECPGGDDESHHIAVTAFQKATARYLLVAGAQRRVNLNPDTGDPFNEGSCPKNPICADMSHQPHSVFERVHEAAFRTFVVPGVGGLGPAKATYQAHRFVAADHDGDGDPEEDYLKLVVNYPTLDESMAANVVVSNGTGGIGAASGDYPSAAANLLADAATSQGFKVCVFNGQPSKASVGNATAQAKAGGCGRLGATANEQGLHLRHENNNDAGDDRGEFLHVETAGSVVEDPVAQQRLAATIGATLNNLF